MYRYVDRQLAAQPPATRIMVAAIREWIAGASQGRCACRLVARRFDSLNAPAAANPFQRAMRCLYGHALLPMHYGAPGRATITEDEALVLAALDRVAEREPAALKALAARIVRPEVVIAFALALTHLEATLDQARHRSGPA